MGVRRRRFTVEEYRRLGGAGALMEDDRVDLFGGAIVEPGPIRDPQVRAVDHLTESLVGRPAGGGATALLAPVGARATRRQYGRMVVNSRPAHCGGKP